MQKNHTLRVFGMIAISLLCGFLAVFTSGLTGWLLLGSFIIIGISSLFNRTKALANRIPPHLVRLLVLFVLLYSIGMLVFGFLCSALSSMNLKFVSEKARFPLSEVEWVQVDNDGAIYCMSFSYFRLQVYDSQGNFLKGWFVPRIKGGYRIALSEKGEVIYGSENEIRQVYDKFGNQIPVKKVHSQKLSAPLSTKFIDKKGINYELRYASFRPQIVKIDQSGDEATLVKDPLGLWIHGMPLPGFGFLLLSVIMSGFGIGLLSPTDRKRINESIKSRLERRRNYLNK